MPDPRYNMFAFTQPYYAVQFAQNNTSYGFYQRFLLSVPQEVYVKINDKKQLKEQQEQLVDVGKLVLTTEAMQVYEKYHDEVVDYRKSDAFEEAKLSIKSKSLGLLLRVSGVISLIRMFLSATDEFLVCKSDIEMALNIITYSINNAFALLPNKISDRSSKKQCEVKKTPLPDPENLTMEYLQQYQKVTKRLLQHEKIPLSSVSRDKIYPVVNNISGSQIASKFVGGLQQLGFGYVSPSSKSFKRYHPEDENCPDKEGLRKKYKQLNLC